MLLCVLSSQQGNSSNSSKSYFLVVCLYLFVSLYDLTVLFKSLPLLFVSHFSLYRCFECGCILSHWYYEREGQLYCKKHYWARYGEHCHGCKDSITKGFVMVMGQIMQTVLLPMRQYWNKFGDIGCKVKATPSVFLIQMNGYRVSLHNLLERRRSSAIPTAAPAGVLPRSLVRPPPVQSCSAVTAFSHGFFVSNAIGNIAVT